MDRVSSHEKGAAPCRGQLRYLEVKALIGRARRVTGDEGKSLTRSPTLIELFETEFREVLGAVVESEDEHPTRPSPGSVGLPDVVVLIRCGVVAQATAARGDSYFYDRAGLARIARNRARRG